MEVLELPDRQFKSLVRLLKVRDLDVVGAVAGLTDDVLKRNKTKRNLEKSVGGVPEGDENVNIGLVKEWLDKVSRPPTAATDFKDRKRDYRRALAQVVALNATAVNRLEG